VYYQRYGDRPWFIEYHWHGLALIAGNAYVLAGLTLFAALAAMSVLIPRANEDVPCPEIPTRMSPASSRSTPS
jgi:hypothetical protein